MLGLKKTQPQRKMSEIKVRLSMEVPGATMLSTQDCVKMSKKEAYDHTTMVVEHQVKKGKKLVTERQTLNIVTRKTKPARRCISISKEAYYHMTDNKEIPSARMVKVWGSLTSKQKLEYHLGLIAENFGATSFSYEVLDD